MIGKASRLAYQGRIGTVVPTSAFEGFTPGTVLLRYERPLLRVMNSPRGEPWLFNWLESNEDFEADTATDEADHTWIAFRVSEARLAELARDKIGLREAILGAEHQPYLVTGPDPIRPKRVRAIPRSTLPTAGLPPVGLTIHGFESSVRVRDVPTPRHVDVHFRLSATDMPAGTLPFLISGTFQERFQRWVSDTAHFAFDPTPRAAAQVYSPEDWSSLRQRASGTGSFRIEAVAEGQPFELERLDEAFAFLERLADPSLSSATHGDLASGIGPSGSFALFSLLHFIMLSKIGVEVRWSYRREGTIKLGQESARAIVRRLQGQRTKFESNARLTIPLTEEDAAKLRLPAVGIGGLQDLIRGLQKQLDAQNVLSVTPSQIERILRYSQSYGSGGFQGRLQGVLNELKRLGASISTLR